MMARIWGWNPDQDSIPQVVYTSPGQDELNVPVSTSISATFDLDMDEATINNSTFVVTGESTGVHQGTMTYDSLSRIATSAPDSVFQVGEIVTVELTTDMQSSQGIPLAGNYAWSFPIMVNAGDCNADGVIDVGDVVYLVNFLYKSGSPPDPLEAGDTNCDDVVNVGDVVYLVNYLFKGGLPPSC
jgi:hypothetical protein